MKRILLMLVASLASVFVAASPAAADSTCPSSNYICLWTSPGYTGQKIATNVHSCQNMVGAQDNSVSSIKVSASPSSNDWRVYLGYNCSGTSWALENGTNLSNIDGTIFGNDISSIGP